jgi:hypothetical protein
MIWAVMTIIIEDLMTMAFATMTENTTNDHCDESICTIGMVIVNVVYDYKCNHIILIFA